MTGYETMAGMDKEFTAKAVRRRFGIFEGFPLNAVRFLEESGKAAWKVYSYSTDGDRALRSYCVVDGKFRAFVSDFGTNAVPRTYIGEEIELADAAERAAILKATAY